MLRNRPKQSFFHLIAFLCLLICAGCLMYSETESLEAAAPDEPVQATQSLLPTATIVADDALGTETNAQSLNEDRWLTLEWPQTIREGDADTIHLTLEVDSEGFLTPTVHVDGHVQSGEPIEIPDLYDTHNLVVEARLDMAGVAIAPYSEIQEPLKRGRPLYFSWSIRPEEAGSYRGTLWIYLNLNPKDGRPGERVTLIAKRLEVECVTFLGLSGRWARILGFSGSVVSFFLGLPFIEKVFYWIYRRFLSKSRRANE